MRASRLARIEPRGPGSDEGGLDVNIAVNRLGVRANRVRGFDQGLGLLAIDARHTNVQTRAEEKRAIRLVQIDFRVDRQIGWKLDLPLCSGELDCAHIAG